MKWLKRSDPALIFFALGTLACLVVSIPATSVAMDIFHGDRWGAVATGVFEFGAVGLELMSLWIPQWRGRLLAAMVGMLVITTLFNYAMGGDRYVAAPLATTTTYAAIRGSGYGWLLTVASSALFPAMLGGFLLGFTARARMVRAKLHTPMAAATFWLSTYGQWLNSQWQDAEARVSSAEQARQTSEQRAAAAEQQVKHLRAELNSRPAPIEVEVIKVARAQLTLEQLAQLAGVSVSTIRRRLPELVSNPDQ
jgi:hypothetical protein